MAPGSLTVLRLLPQTFSRENLAVDFQNLNKQLTDLLVQYLKHSLRSEADHTTEIGHSVTAVSI